MDGNQKKSVTTHIVGKTEKQKKRKRFKIDIGLQIVHGLLLNQKEKKKKFMNYVFLEMTLMALSD